MPARTADSVASADRKVIVVFPVGTAFPVQQNENCGNPCRDNGRSGQYDGRIAISGTVLPGWRFGFIIFQFMLPVTVDLLQFMLCRLWRGLRCSLRKRRIFPEQSEH